MTDLTLYLIRHASADERGPAYPDDSKRPLTAKGQDQAAALGRLFTRLDIGLDRLFSSPYTRAAQTAEPLAAVLKRGQHIHYLDALADDRYPQLLSDLGDYLDGDVRVAALVGHEPFLSELASYLLSGNLGVPLRFRKGALLELSGDLSAAGMSLQQFLPAALYKHLV